MPPSKPPSKATDSEPDQPRRRAIPRLFRGERKFSINCCTHFCIPLYTPLSYDRSLNISLYHAPAVRQMMAGFGDHQNPRVESIGLMEEMVIDYFTILVAKTTMVANANRRERPDVTDVKYVIRKQPKKLARVRYLLDMKTEIKRAINAIDPDGGDEKINGK